MNSLVHIPSVSLIIPVYKAENFIEDCLNSIKAQTFSDFEIILVDDASPDNSVALIEKFEGKNKDLKLRIIHHERNRGASAARNTGIENAYGKYLFFVDSDDELLPNCLQILVDAMGSDSFDIVGAENYMLHPDSEALISIPVSGAIYGNEIKHKLSQRVFPVVPWNKLYSREFITKNDLRFVEGMAYEDEVWNFQTLCLADAIKIVNIPTYKYILRTSSLMGSSWNTAKQWLNYIEVDRIISEWSETNGLLSNTGIAKYILDSKVLLIGKLNNHGLFTSTLFYQIINRGIVSTKALYQTHVISFKMLIAYYYFNLNRPFSFLYYKFLNNLHSLLGKLRNLLK